MGLILPNNKGQTPLSPDEMDGLLIRSISTQIELDEQEQLNIESAIRWTMQRSLSGKNILSAAFIKALHKKMYGNVWRWAGQFRTSDKNIGVSWYQIPSDLQALIDDAIYWLDHQTFPPDELAIRFKHRIVSIHCFPNGNGRHSRLMADLIVSKLFQLPPFSWGSVSNTENKRSREVYLHALKLADQQDILPLLQFSRS